MSFYRRKDHAPLTAEFIISIGAARTRRILLPPNTTSFQLRHLPFSTLELSITILVARLSEEHQSRH